MRSALLWATLLCWSSTSIADGSRHSLWQLHGKHNTVYLLGSIHVLRQSDYPLDAVVLHAYADSSKLVMEIDLAEIDTAAVQAEMLASALLPDGKTLTDVLGTRRYTRAATLAHAVGVDLSSFDLFAPWFAAEAVSQLQLSHLGFQPEAGVEMYFLDRARGDGKSVAGLETVHDQISVFQGLSADSQANYLMSSLEEASVLPQEVVAMVRAWKLGDTAWFEREFAAQMSDDPILLQAVLGGRNRHWLPKIEALLNDDQNYLVIVGTGHLVGPDSVIELLRKDGVGAAQL